MSIVLAAGMIPSTRGNGWMAISGDIYRRVGRASAGAVSVVATHEHASGAIVALTASSFVTLSFEPPLVMFAIQNHASSFAPMVTAKSFGVSLLNVEQAHVAQRFARKRSDEDKEQWFELGKTLQAPLIPGALAQIECVTNEIFMSGDHAIVVGLVEAAHTTQGRPLLYFDRQYGAFDPLAT